jgi:hypothetical protein
MAWSVMGIAGTGLLGTIPVYIAEVVAQFQAPNCVGDEDFFGPCGWSQVVWETFGGEKSLGARMA